MASFLMFGKMVMLDNPAFSFRGIYLRSINRIRGILITINLAAILGLEPSVLNDSCHRCSFARVWIEHGDNNPPQSRGIDEEVEAAHMRIVSFVWLRFITILMLKIPSVPPAHQLIVLWRISRFGYIPKRSSCAQANHHNCGTPNVESTRIVIT